MTSHHRLPRPLTSLVGREDVRAQVRDALSRSRLVTLTGFGGMGKSRLALAVAEEFLSGSSGDAVFVPLDVLDPGAPVDGAVFTAVGGTDQSTRSPRDLLVTRLSDAEILLVLDNCEHVAGQVVDLLGHLLPQLPRLRVLATSRASLGCLGERVVPVPPLSTPAAEGAPDAYALGRFESVRLLMERAVAVRPDFELTDEVAADVAALCERLEGSPLAIELAASRLRSMSVKDVLERVERSGGFLRGTDPFVPRRHSSVEAVIASSWRLCSAEEQVVWSRASVFAGAFDLAAAEAVCATASVPSSVVADCLDQLVAKSIVLADTRGPRGRYRLLETLRQFGLARLDDSEPMDAWRAHRDHYAQRARTALARWATDEQIDAMADLQAQAANIERALRWAFAQPEEEAAAVSLVNSLRHHWAIGGNLRRGRRWLDRALELRSTDAALRLTSAWVAGWVALVQGDLDATASYLAHADQLAAEAAPGEAIEEASGAAYVLLMRGALALFRSSFDEAESLLRRSTDDFDRLDDLAGSLFGAMLLIVTLAHQGRHVEAEQRADDALERSARTGDIWGRSQVLWAFALDRWLMGDVMTAREKAVEALRVSPPFNQVGIALYVELLAWIAASAGDFGQAALALGAAQARWVRLGTGIGSFGAHFSEHSEACRRAMTGALPARVLGARLHEGATIDLAELIEGSQSVTQHRELPHRVRLTRRENEIAQLLAEGLSNRQIAERLVISHRTVEGHVENLLAKLHLKTRTQVAAWVLTEAP